MSDLAKRRIRVDWAELEDAFADSSADHRYYLNRETGAVLFFSSYLESEEEEEDERALTGEERYVLIPHARRLLPSHEIREFVASLTPEETRLAVASSLQSTGDYGSFEEAVAALELSQVARWTFQTAQRFHKYYERFRILGETDAARRTERAALVWMYRERLQRVLGLMGIPVPERM